VSELIDQDEPGAPRQRCVEVELLKLHASVLGLAPRRPCAEG